VCVYALYLGVVLPNVVAPRIIQKKIFRFFQISGDFGSPDFPRSYDNISQRKLDYGSCLVQVRKLEIFFVTLTKNKLDCFSRN
jgi:hypothetical protein